MKIELLAVMGNDDMVANSARVSMAKLASNYTPEQNAKLIKYLVQNSHWTPLAHPQVQFRITVPLFIARQLTKHQVGAVVNEVSRRYVSDEPTYYWPTWRQAPEKSIKQGSGDAFDAEKQERVNGNYEAYLHQADTIYRGLLRDGVAPEQARMVLPQSMYTELVVTGSLYYWARMHNQRTDPHAQKEWAELMAPLNEVMLGLFPVSWVELTKR